MLRHGNVIKYTSGPPHRPLPHLHDAGGTDIEPPTSEGGRGGPTTEAEEQTTAQRRRNTTREGPCEAVLKVDQ